jgi:hypothetical protein
MASITECTAQEWAKRAKGGAWLRHLWKEGQQSKSKEESIMGGT